MPTTPPPPSTPSPNQTDAILDPSGQLSAQSLELIKSYTERVRRFYKAPGKELNDASDTAEKGLDALADILTFGKHGRRRDKDRAQHQEDLSRRIKEGTEQTLLEKKNGLQVQLRFAEQSLAKWEVFAQRFPITMDHMALLIQKSQEILRQRETSAKSGEVADQAIKETSKQLKLLVALLKGMKANPQDEETPALQAWNASVRILSQLAQTTNETAETFIHRAIEGADKETLNSFITELGGLYADLQSYSKLIQENIQQDKADIEAILKQLEELNK